MTAGCPGSPQAVPARHTACRLKARRGGPERPIDYLDKPAQEADQQLLT